MGLYQTVEEIGRRAFALCRGTLVKADDSHKWQEVRVRTEHGDDWSNVEVAHPYGFTSVAQPPADDQTSEAAEVIVIFPDGSRSHPIVIQCGDRRFRLKGLAEGEVAIHDDQGQKVHFKRDQTLVYSPKPILVQSAELVTLRAPDIELDGTVWEGGTKGDVGMRPVSARGTVTTDGASDTSNFLTKVNGK